METSSPSKREDMIEEEGVEIDDVMQDIALGR